MFKCFRQEIAEKLRGVHTPRVQQCGHSIHDNRTCTERPRGDSEPQEQRRNLFEQFDFTHRTLNRNGHKEPLRFQRPFGHARKKRGKHRAFVQSVLVHDHDAISVFGDHVATEQLDERELVKMDCGVRRGTRRG